MSTSTTSTSSSPGHASTSRSLFHEPCPRRAKAAPPGGRPFLLRTESQEAGTFGILCSNREDAVASAQQVRFKTSMSLNCHQVSRGVRLQVIDNIERDFVGLIRKRQN